MFCSESKVPECYPAEHPTACRIHARKFPVRFRRMPVLSQGKSLQSTKPVGLPVSVDIYSCVKPYPTFFSLSVAYPRSWNRFLGIVFLIVMHYCCASCSGSEWFNPPCYLTPWRVIKFRLHRHGIQLRRPWQYEAAFMSGENIFTVHADKLFRRENNGCRRVFRISRTGQS